MKKIEPTKATGVKWLGSWKIFNSPEYHYRFNYDTGFMIEWGRTTDENPNWCKYGPTILDIEVTTICKGPNGIPCPFCYKCNTPKGHNMSLERFKEVLDAMPETLTQVAFGADAQATSNPDLWAMMEYCREKKVVPNITVADIDWPIAYKLQHHCGAVAVSAYNHVGFDVCFDSIERLCDSVIMNKFDHCTRPRTRADFIKGGMAINIHYMISEQTADGAMRLMDAYENDYRLEYVNAIVFLHLKKKGRGAGYDIISDEAYKKIVDYAFEHNIPIGFDTCGAGKFNIYVNEHMPEKKEAFDSCIESCCAGRLSCYINEHGEYFPCSFMEGTEGDWAHGIKVTKDIDFVNDVWYNRRVKEFGYSALKCGQENKGCPYWEV